MGELWVADNLLPPESLDHYSTLSGPLEVPAGSRVTTFAANELDDRVLPYVGMVHRDAEEEALIADLAAALP